MPELVLPTTAVHASFVAAMKEFESDGRAGDGAPRGHATAMLREGLVHAHRLGIDPVLITCDHDNIASRRVIESGDGALEDRRGDKLRYWVPTA
ncbi:hypothetical protein N566_17420 [Streptomycetaceae bacterium MP113-05]|nr:hypothetical protein N566_17420 [Streptomycetaceae bacterium MP113-05]